MKADALWQVSFTPKVANCALIFCASSAFCLKFSGAVDSPAAGEVEVEVAEVEVAVAEDLGLLTLDKGRSSPMIVKARP